MAFDEIFSFLTQQVATVLSIFVIVFSAVWKINKRGDERDMKLKVEINDTAVRIKNEAKVDLDIANRLLDQRLAYIERDITSMSSSITRLDESVRKHHEQHERQ